MNLARYKKTVSSALWLQMVLKITLGTLSYTLEKALNLRLFLFVPLSLSFITSLARYIYFGSRNSATTHSSQIHLRPDLPISQ